MRDLDSVVFEATVCTLVLPLTVMPLDVKLVVAHDSKAMKHCPSSAGSLRH